VSGAVWSLWFRLRGEQCADAAKVNGLEPDGFLVDEGDGWDNEVDDKSDALPGMYSVHHRDYPVHRREDLGCFRHAERWTDDIDPDELSASAIADPDDHHHVGDSDLDGNLDGNQHHVGHPDGDGDIDGNQHCPNHGDNPGNDAPDHDGDAKHDINANCYYYLDHLLDCVCHRLQHHQHHELLDRVPNRNANLDHHAQHYPLL